VGWREHSFTTKNSALGVGTIADVPLLARAILLRRSNAWLSNPGRSTFSVFPFAVPAEFVGSPSIARLAPSVRRGTNARSAKDLPWKAD
jgi:hypothetical protein